MADAPLPYAPPTVGVEPAVIRAATRPALFVIAAFVMTLIGPGYLWIRWSRLLEGAGIAAEGTWPFYVLCCAPATLSVLWGLLSDTHPIMDARREGHLLVGALVAAVGWLVPLVSPGGMAAAVVAGCAVQAAPAIAEVAIAGALVEIGRRRGTTGRLAAAWLAAMFAANLVVFPLLPALTRVPAPLQVVPGSALALVVVLLVVVMADWVSKRLPVVPARVTPLAYLRSRTLWTSAAVVMCGAVASMPEVLIGTNDWPPHAGEVMCIAKLAAAGGYAIACRRMAFTRRLHVAMMLNVLVALALVPIWEGGNTSAAHVLAVVALGFAEGFVQVALSELALRAAPDGREGFGTMVLFALYNAAWAGWGELAPLVRPSFAMATTIAAAAGMVAMFAVGSLPPSIVARPEGEPAPA